MTTHRSSTEKQVMVAMNIRHSPEIKAFLDEKAAESNEHPSAYYRRILNTGIEAVFSVKIKNNKFVKP